MGLLGWGEVHGIPKKPLDFLWNINLHGPPWMGGVHGIPKNPLGFSMEYQSLWASLCGGESMESVGIHRIFYGISIFMGLLGWVGESTESPDGAPEPSPNLSQPFSQPFFKHMGGAHVFPGQPRLGGQRQIWIQKVLEVAHLGVEKSIQVDESSVHESVATGPPWNSWEPRGHSHE